MSADEGAWMPIAVVVERIAEAAKCSLADACRRIANRLHDREFRLAADKVVSQVRDPEYLVSLMLGETLPFAVPPMVQTVDEHVQLTALMFPPGALNSDSPLWTGEASFPVPHEGPLARVTYYGVRISLATLHEHFPEVLITARPAPVGMARRAPSVKAGRPPSDGEILAKADELKDRGLKGREIEKVMRCEPGFEHVATTTIRDLIKGRWKPSGRPGKGA